MNDYVFRSAEIGWINSDRPYKISKRVGTLKIKSKDYVDVKMIFSKQRIVLDSRIDSNSDYIFTGVPFDTPVLIYIVKYSDNQYEYTITETNTSKLATTSFDFKKLIVDDLDKEMQKVTNW